MYCSNCGKELPNNSNYCPNCGTKLNGHSLLLKRTIINFYNAHKTLSIVFLSWLLIHLSLLIFSSKERTDVFYPFSGRWGSEFNDLYMVLRDFPYEDIFFGYVDCYDFSEFFFYVILVPLFFYGIVLLNKKIWKGFVAWKQKRKETANVKDTPYNMATYEISLASTVTFDKYHDVLRVIANKKNGFWTSLVSPVSETHFILSEESPLAKDIRSGTNVQCIWNVDESKFRSMTLNGKVYYVELEIDKYESVKAQSIGNEIIERELTVQNENSEFNSSVTKVQIAEIKEEQSLTEKDVKKMPLFRRLIGSIIDKFLILAIFVLGSIAINPYGSAGRLGTYMGLMNASPHNYEYIDQAAIDRYGTYTNGVSQYFQDMERLENEPPHIGSTMELDMSITFSFIIFNILYYILFECILSASLGKRVLGGVLLDSFNNKINWMKALLRAICGGLIMSSVYLLFHVLMGFSNFVVIVVFFLLLDLPVFFTNKSLIDMCTSTFYVVKS